MNKLTFVGLLSIFFFLHHRRFEIPSRHKHLSVCENVTIVVSTLKCDLFFVRCVVSVSSISEIQISKLLGEIPITKRFMHEHTHILIFQRARNSRHEIWRVGDLSLEAFFLSRFSPIFRMKSARITIFILFMQMIQMAEIC